MTLYSSREGRLCVDGKRVPKPIVEGIFPKDQFISGELSIPATENNILGVSQLMLDLFINPMGMILEKRPKGKRWSYSTLDIEKQYGSPGGEEYEVKPLRGQFRSERNLTRGWCLFATGALHRFFRSEFDCFRGKCLYDETNGYHWWLENSSGDVIDLCEKQYRISKLYDLRKDGKNLRNPAALRYAPTSRNMAFKISEVLSDNTYDVDLIPKNPSQYNPNTRGSS